MTCKCWDSGTQLLGYPPEASFKNNEHISLSFKNVGHLGLVVLIYELIQKLIGP
jgi:hypothetical protein